MESQEILASKLLAQILVEEDLFYSVDEEATSMAECIVCLADGHDTDAANGIDDEGDGGNNKNSNKRTSKSHCSETVLVSINRAAIRDRLVEYIDAGETVADRIVELLIKRLRRQGEGDGGSSSSSSDDDIKSTDGSTSSSSDDVSTAGSIIVDGQCELCERVTVNLTKHHLIPKSTWPKIEIKVLRSIEALIDDKDSEKAKMIVGDGLIDLVDEVRSMTEKSNKVDRKMAVQTVLRRRTTDICRPCHSAVHTTHDNMILAMNLNSVERLLDDTKIYNFCKWQSKQRPGRYAKPFG